MDIDKVLLDPTVFEANLASTAGLHSRVPLQIHAFESQQKAELSFILQDPLKATPPLKIHPVLCLAQRPLSVIRRPRYLPRKMCSCS